MRGRRVWTIGATVAVIVGIAIAFTRPASSHNQYEVWAIDQSDSPGKTYGGTLYIWDGQELETRRGVRKHDEDQDAERFDALRWIRPAKHQRIDLGEEVSALCFARTGANPVRPHMIAVNPACCNDRPGELHDAVGTSLPIAGAAARQRANLPHHRFVQPVYVRHAPRRRPLRHR